MPALTRTLPVRTWAVLVCQRMPQIHRLLLPVLAVLCPLALAQVAARPEAPVDIRIGESSVSLAGPWKFAPGDSPRAGGGLLWASPEFDDRAWYSMDLRSERAQIDPGYGNPEFVTGWTDRGFPKLAGFAWYRLRVHIADPAQKLAIKMPDHVDDAYQVFANGKFLGEFGHFKESGVE
jgi:hypothetical protein